MRIFYLELDQTVDKAHVARLWHLVHQALGITGLSLLLLSVAFQIKAPLTRFFQNFSN